MNIERTYLAALPAGARKSLTIAAAAALLLPLTAGRAAAEPASVRPAISAGGQAFSSWQDYYSSQYFVENGKRCGKPPTVLPRTVDPSDCTAGTTVPSGDYASGLIYEIPVVVHIIEHSNGDGQISDTLVHSQIDILNEDFRALAGTLGAGGYDTGIRFALATIDPGGSSTTGITRTVNDNWFNDNGTYWNSLAWDPNRYMNIYTNGASGNLGYVPDLPQAGGVGSNSDRVVILWSAFGRNASGGPPYDQGRTTTHEVGHYLGLEHTFEGGCASPSSPACYSNGDLICDTNPESQPNYGCPAGSSSCSSSDPIDNYMDYSDDTCMDEFTMEQGLRMRCSLLNYRPDLYTITNPAVCGDNVRGGLEQCDGTDDAACSGLCLGNCTCPPPVCGNEIVEQGEDCDGTNDGACPGECDGICHCPLTCGSNAYEKRKAKFSDSGVKFKGILNDFGGTFAGADPRNDFTFSITQGAASVLLTIPALDSGWEKSKPSKGKYLWKGNIGGFNRVKALDRSGTSLGAWKILVRGKLVPGGGAIDELSAYDIYLRMDGACAETP